MSPMLKFITVTKSETPKDEEEPLIESEAKNLINFFEAQKEKERLFKIFPYINKC